MTAPLFPGFTPIQPLIYAWLNQQQQPHKDWLAVFPPHSSTESKSQVSEADLSSERPQSFPDVTLTESSFHSLFDRMGHGVLLVSDALKPIYCNQRAQQFCEQLRSPQESLSDLPLLVTSLCRRLLEEDPANAQPILMQCQTPDYSMRLQGCWLIQGSNPVTPEGVADLILVLFEDCAQRSQEDLLLEKNKYALTGREAEVWILLRQNYSYKEISNQLQITVNTVKTHVRNVYNKQKVIDQSKKVWFSR